MNSNAQLKSDLVIRPAELKDFAEYVSLLNHLHSSEEIHADDAATLAQWQELQANQYTTCYLAWLGQTAVASAVLAVIPNLTRGARSFAVIQNVVTHTDYRGQGFGSALMKEVLAATKELNCYQTLLQTGRPEVVDWYKRLGFTEEKIGLVHKW